MYVKSISKPSFCSYDVKVTSEEAKNILKLILRFLVFQKILYRSSNAKMFREATQLIMKQFEAN